MDTYHYTLVPPPLSRTHINLLSPVTTLNPSKLKEKKIGPKNAPSRTPSLRSIVPLSLHDLLSPFPLIRSSRTRLSEQVEMAEESGEQNRSHRRCKNHNGNVGLARCASPRNGKRIQRRLEQDIREKKDLVVVEELVTVIRLERDEPAVG